MIELFAWVSTAVLVVAGYMIASLWSKNRELRRYLRALERGLAEQRDPEEPHDSPIVRQLAEANKHLRKRAGMDEKAYTVKLAQNTEAAYRYGRDVKAHNVALKHRVAELLLHMADRDLSAARAAVESLVHEHGCALDPSAYSDHDRARAMHWRPAKRIAMVEKDAAQ